MADAVAGGLLSSALIERLNELEAHKKDLEAQLSCSSCLHTLEALAIDPLLIPAQYAEDKRYQTRTKLYNYLMTSSDPAARDFLRNIIQEIRITNDTIRFSLKID